jgi:hypothetical protein
MFGGTPTTNESVAHADLFPEGGFEEITSMAQLTQLTTERALVIYWNPNSEEIYEALEALNQVAFKIRVGCIDVSRYSSVSHVRAPYARLYEHVRARQSEVIKEQPSYANLIELISARGLQVIGRKTQVIEYAQGSLDQPKKYLAEHFDEVTGLVNAQELELLQKWASQGQIFDIPQFIGAVIKLARGAQPSFPYLDILRQLAMREACSAILIRSWSEVSALIVQNLQSQEPKSTGQALKLLCNLFCHADGRTFLATKASEISALVVPSLAVTSLKIPSANFFTNLLNSLRSLAEDDWGKAYAAIEAVVAIVSGFNSTSDPKELLALGEALGLFISKSEELKQLVISLDISVGVASLGESALASDLGVLVSIG